MKFVKFVILIFPLFLFSNTLSYKIDSHSSNYRFGFNQFKQKIILKLQNKINENLSTNSIEIRDNFTLTTLEKLITFDTKSKTFMIDLENLNNKLSKKLNNKILEIKNDEYIENPLQRIKYEMKILDQLLLPVDYNKNQKKIILKKIKNLKKEISLINFYPLKSIDIINNSVPNLPIIIVNYKNIPIKNMYFIINSKEFKTDKFGKIFLNNLRNYRSLSIKFDIDKNFEVENLNCKKFFKQLLKNKLNYLSSQIQVNIFSPPLIHNIFPEFDSALLKNGFRVTKQKANYLFVVKYITLNSGKSQIQGYFAKIKGDAYIYKKQIVIKHFAAIEDGLSLISIKDAKKKAKIKIQKKLQKIMIKK